MKVIDYKETMKCLDEVEDCEDKTYAKSLLEWAINKRTFEAIPLSVIEDIKSVLELFSNEANKACEASNYYSIRDKLRTLAQAYDNVARLIDCKIAETTGDKKCSECAYYTPDIKNSTSPCLNGNSSRAYVAGTAEKCFEWRKDE